jgi:FMN phosphatase YigB (HAD superfamily)
MSTLLATIDTTSPGYGLQLINAIKTSAPGVVCFDYFDTIVTRTLHPEDVKRISCERLARALDLPSSEGSSLYSLRSELETELSQKNEAAGHDQEFELRQLAIALRGKLPLAQAMPPQRFADLLISIEISVECMAQRLDPEIVNVIRQLRLSREKCWLVSDFYLAESDFRRLLSFHGIDDAFDEVYVSSSHLRSKRSGRIYPVLVERSALEPHHILMIGDNSHSDVASSNAHGLKSIHIDREQQHSRYAILTRQTNDASFAIHAVRKLLTAANIPFAESALTLYWFIDRLYASLLGKGIKDVFFLAREGQLLKVMFDEFQSSRHPPDAIRIRSHYLEVSRRSTFLPSLLPLEQETFEILFRQYRRISVNEFLASLGLDDQAPELELQLGRQLNERVEDLPTDAIFVELVANEVFREAYERERIGRREAFLSYLNSFDYDKATETLCVVDVGWKGSIQDNLYALLSSTTTTLTQLDGYYLGVIAPGAIGPMNRKTGLVLSAIGKPTKNQHVFNENRALFEVLLAADHGSARSYEFSTKGDAVVARQEFTEEPLFSRKIRPLQLELLKCFNQVDEVLRGHVFSNEHLRRLVTTCHARMVFQPTAAEVSWFEDVYHVENFGVFELSKFATKSRPAGVVQRLRFYLALRRGRIDFDPGFWPWLTYYHRGGQFVASRYGRSQTRKIED